jgi:hypothetical protein
MCWFNIGKKDKEKIALLEQRVETLETQVLDILGILENLNETDGRLAAENYLLKDLITSHIQNDMDMTEGDETTWGEN